MIETLRLGFVGCGSMAGALIGGLIHRGIAPERIVASDPRPEPRERLAAEHGVTTTPENGVAVAAADIIVLAVKPEHVRTAAGSLALRFVRDPPPLVISVAAGIPLAALARWCGARVPIVRAMPNQPALEGYGATGLFAPAGVGARERGLAESLMAAVGVTAWVEHEAQMDIVTALSGSGPAYFFRFMELLEAAALERGLPADIAKRFTLETALGAAQLAHGASCPLATLRERVTSRGGTTAAALAVFEAGGLPDLIAAALEAAAHRSAELARELGGTDPA